MYDYNGCQERMSWMGLTDGFDLGYCGIPQDCEWEDASKNISTDCRPGERFGILLEKAWIQEACVEMLSRDGCR